MVKKQEISKEERCVNPKVFQEYISAARLVIWLNFFEPSFLLHTFISCLFFSSWTNSENDLEEVLTFYTQKNKSATVFLGTKVRGIKKDVREASASRDSGNCDNSKCEFLVSFPMYAFCFFYCTSGSCFNFLSFKHSKQELFRFVNLEQWKEKRLSHLGWRKGQLQMIRTYCGKTNVCQSWGMSNWW